MLSAFHSAVVDVRDFEAGVRDTARMLGRDPLRIETGGDDGRRSAIFGLANTTLELRAPEIAPSGGDDDSAATPPRFGQAGIRLACEAPDPADWLASRDVAVSARGTRESSFENGPGVRRFGYATIALDASRGIPIDLVADETIEPAPGAGTAYGLADDDSSAVDPAACIRALDHVVVMSPAAEATRRLYADQLGIRLALDKTFEARGVRLIFFRIGGVTIEIGARLAAEEQPARADRFGGLAWQVIDIEAIHARLAGDGFDVSEIRTGNKPGTRVCTVREPVHDVPTLLIEPVG